MKKLLTIAVVLSLLTATSCGSSQKAVSVTDKQTSKQTGISPEVEVTFPCSGIDSDEEFLRVNGNGNSKDRTMAKERAYNNALAELASKMAGVSSMSNKRVGVSTNADGEEFHDKMIAIATRIAKASVAGYRTSCEKYTVSTDNGSYNCYVTIELGKQKIVKQLYEEANAEKLLKADYDFDRYLKEFNQDLQEYEKSNK